MNLVIKFPKLISSMTFLLKVLKLMEVWIKATLIGGQIKPLKEEANQFVVILVKILQYKEYYKHKKILWWKNKKEKKLTFFLKYY